MRATLITFLFVSVITVPIVAQTRPGREEPSRHRTPAWIVAYNGVSAMQQQPRGAEVVKKLLADPRTIIVAANPLSSTFDKAQRGVSVMDLDACKTVIEKPSNAGLKILFVDLEAWQQTPRSEQENPEAATRRCHEWAHQNGRDISVIATPAMNLMRVIDPKYKGNQYESAIHYNLEGRVAAASDGVDVQVENIEDKPEQFERTLRAMIEEIKLARRKAGLNADVPIYAGLSTGVVGKQIPTDVLVNALKEDVRRTRDLVTGYWMAIPPKSLCPGCGEPNPEVAVKLLESLDE